MTKKSSGDYEVGKNKPPKEHQFQPGQTGNPKGRPKGSKNVHHVLSKVLNEKISVSDAGQKLVVDKLEGAIRVLVNKSFEGKPQSLKLLLDLLRDGEQVSPASIETPFTKEDKEALFEELDWLDEVRAAYAPEVDDDPE